MLERKSDCRSRSQARSESLQVRNGDIWLIGLCMGVRSIGSVFNVLSLRLPS